MELDNPIHITRLQMTHVHTQRVNTDVIKLYHQNLPYPVLQLFPSQQFWLKRVGIDPNELAPNEMVAVDFFAEWRENNRTTQRGRHYKDVTRLHPSDNHRPDLTEVTGLLESINHKLDTLLHLNGIRN